MTIILNPGDIFCTRNPMMLGRVICCMEKFWSSDNEAKYSHAGIIVGRPAITFEALWTNKKQNLFKAYDGTEVLIGRHEDMTVEKFNLGWQKIKNHEGKIYAGWRLFFHIIPPLAKYLSSNNFGVCSEITGEFIEGSGIYPEGYFWKGKTPDNIADMIHKWKKWTPLYEDKLDKLKFV